MLSLNGSISNDGKEDGACLGVWVLLKKGFFSFLSIFAKVHMQLKEKTHDLLIIIRRNDFGTYSWIFYLFFFRYFASVYYRGLL